MTKMVTGGVEQTNRKKSRSLSKKKKKHWRKNIDLTDFEEALEKRRLELRTGGLVADKKDSELFVLGENDTEIESKKDDRLTVDKIIVPNPDLVKEAKVQSKVDKTRQSYKRNEQLERLQTKLKRKASKMTKPQETDICDIWSKSAEEVRLEVFKKSAVRRYTDEVKIHPPKIVPETILKKAPFNQSAVEVAHPGASYNPSFEDHQALLSQENEKEIKREKKEQKIKRSLDFNRKERVTDEIASLEMQEGLFDGDSNSDDNDSGVEEILTTLDKPFKMKSKRQNIHEKKLLRQRRKKEFLKKRKRDLHCLKALVLEIEQKSKENQDKKANKVNTIKQPRISKVKYVEPDPKFKLSKELEGSLRKLKPAGSVAFDRFHSFQKRCFIEPRKKSKIKKLKRYKLKENPKFKKITLD